MVEMSIQFGASQSMTDSALLALWKLDALADFPETLFIKSGEFLAFSC